MAHYFFDEPNDTKLIILLIAANFKRPVTISDVTDLVISQGIADYFPLAQSMAELEAGGLLHSAVNAGAYVITEKGREALALFGKSLPHSVRTSLLSAIQKAHVSEKEAESVVATYKRENDMLYTFFGEVTERGVPVFSMSVTLPSEATARTAVRNFKQNAGEIYAEVIKKLSETQK